MILICTEFNECKKLEGPNSHTHENLSKLLLAAHATVVTLIKKEKITQEEWDDNYRKTKLETDKMFDEKKKERSFCEIF